MSSWSGERRNRTTMEDQAQALLDKYNIKTPRSGAYIPPGWFPLIERLIVDLTALGWDLDCQQIKVKFGGLRFYTGSGDPALPESTRDAIRDRIQAAEVEAAVTCAVCGAPGGTKPGHGYSVVCDAHAATTDI